MELLTVESRLWSEIGEFDLKKGRVVNVKLDVLAGASLNDFIRIEGATATRCIITCPPPPYRSRKGIFNSFSKIIFK